MNKINICENFKNENLPLIFNINYLHTFPATFNTSHVLANGGA